VRVLLDSHVILWWDHDLSRLSGTQKLAIGDPANDVFVSAVTSWELGIKSAAGKLILNDSIQTLADRFAFIELPVTLRHGEVAASLPSLHKDPFDRMLVSQAICEGMVLLTVDRRLSEYGVATL
jgi:PIN domain nuclease of toxin-antitoxin system